MKRMMHLAFGGILGTALLLASGQPLAAQPAPAPTLQDAPTTAPAPQGAAPSGWGLGSAYGRLYNPDTVQTVSGKVTDVQRISPMGRMSAGVHLTLQTDSGNLPVHLGPAWFLDNQDVRIEPGDQVQVTGSRIQFQGQPAIIAAELRRGDQVLTLRDDAGVPAWSGWRRQGDARGQGMMGPDMMGRGMGQQMGRGPMDHSMNRGMMKQQMGRGPMGPGMMEGQQMPMAQMAGGRQAAPDAPASLLAERQRLNLSDEQVQKLQKIQSDARAAARAVLTEQQQRQLEPTEP